MAANVCAKTCSLSRSKTARDPGDIWRIIHRGGYPELQEPGQDWNSYYADYVKTYLERDVRSLKAVHDLAAFRQFMVAVASRTAQVLNYSNIAEEIGKDVGTVKSWVSILETSGIVYLLRPYASSELKRTIRAPKLHFKNKVRGQGAVVCNCSAPTHLRDNLLAMPVWYL